ncbi:hypothetical protein [Rothia halotolerans]|uniref:hypothetical protein n=1 Tax=Rothia halotolerans TaxID=405770 RepID=UPI00101DF593|nr:hypothetical protein [Rothia halotolerans]
MISSQPTEQDDPEAGSGQDESFSTEEMAPRARNQLANLWEEFDHDKEFARKIGAIVGCEGGWNVPEHVVPHELRQTRSYDKAIDLIAAVSEALADHPGQRDRFEAGANQIFEEHEIPYAFAEGALTRLDNRG